MIAFVVCTIYTRHPMVSMAYYYQKPPPPINYVRTEGGGGASLLYISIAYYMLKRGGGGPDSMYNCVRTKWKAPKYKVLTWMSKSYPCKSLVVQILLK